MKRLSFPIGYPWLPCQILVDLISKYLILWSLFCSTGLYIFVPILYSVYYCCLKLGGMIPPALFFSSRLLWLFRVFCSSIQILRFFFYFCEECHHHYDGDCIESSDDFGLYGHLSSFMIHAHRSICLVLWFLSAKSYSFHCRDFYFLLLSLFLNVLLFLMLWWMEEFSFFYMFHSFLKHRNRFIPQYFILGDCKYYCIFNFCLLISC